MNLTRDDFLTVFMPLVLALHEKKLIDIAELPHYYEDVLMRRMLDLHQDEADLAFLRELIQGLHRLAVMVKTTKTPPPQ